MTTAQQKAIIRRAADANGIDPALLWGVYGTETGFGRNLGPSSAGAVGPFQFEPGTAAAMGVDPNNFTSAAYGAARLLAQNSGRGIAGMLSAYNAGPAGGIQPSYVASVLRLSKTWNGSNTAAGSAAATSSPTTPGSSSGSTAGGLISHDQAHGAMYALVWFGLVLIGGFLILAGVNSATGGAPGRAARKAAVGAVA